MRAMCKYSNKMALIWMNLFIWEKTCHLCWLYFATTLKNIFHGQSIKNHLDGDVLSIMAYLLTPLLWTNSRLDILCGALFYFWLLGIVAWILGWLDKYYGFRNLIGPFYFFIIHTLRPKQRFLLSRSGSSWGLQP